MLLSTTCDAASYKVVGSGDGYIAFVDADSAVKDGSFITYDLLFVALPPRRIENQLMHYMIEQEKLDCHQQTIQVLSISAFGTDDKIIGKDDTPAPPEIIFPDSISDSQFNLLCRGVKPSISVPEYNTLPSAVKAGDQYIKEHIIDLPTH